MGIFDSIIKKKNEQRSAPVATEKKPEEPKAPARERKPLIDEGFLRIFSK